MLLSEDLQTALTEELKMIGFRAARSSPTVIARVNACTKYEEGGSKPDIQVWISPAGKKLSWMPKLKAELERVLGAEMERTKGFAYQRGKEGDVCQGLAEIGDFSVQNSYSDDSYIAVRADIDGTAKAVLDAVKKVVKTGGGGVAGSRYSASGAVAGGNGEYTYHYSSFGIGD